MVGILTVGKILSDCLGRSVSMDPVCLRTRITHNTDTHIMINWREEEFVGPAAATISAWPGDIYFSLKP